MNEPLTRSAVLPYFEMIAAANPKENTQFVLFTLEKERYALSQEEGNALKLRLSKDHVLWMPR
ncbi:MAG: hypothetical protein O2984_06185, partial [Bacteroidetes bacterium]|nr:hypothetical protein [Bacteroidota bacterium]